MSNDYEKREQVMSADNWTKCPKCDVENQKNIQLLLEEIEEAYGKLSFPDFEEFKTANQLKVQELENAPDNLREDYFLGIWEGNFNVSYRGRCNKCDYAYSYEYSDNNLVAAETEE